MNYEDIEAINSSTLKHMLHSPARFKRALDGEMKFESDAVKVGSAIHVLSLEPKSFDDRYVVLPEFHLEEGNVTKTGKRSTNKKTEYCDKRKAEFLRAHQGKIVLNQGEYGVVNKAADVIRRHPRFATIAHEPAEVILEGEIAGIRCKSRLDKVRANGAHPLVFDLKTCRDCSPHGFGRQFANLQYGFQLAFYREMFRQNYDKDPSVAVLAAETSGEYDRAWYVVPGAVLDSGWSKVIWAFQEYIRWRDAGKWPGVERGKDKLDLYVPQWAMEDAGDELEGFEDEGAEPEKAECYF